MPVKYYTEEEFAAERKRASYSELALADIERVLSEELADKADCYSKGRYPHIPLPMEVFIELMTAAKAQVELQKGTKYAYHYSIRFLDVGCGIGTKVRIAYDGFNLRAAGLEINSKYAEFARKLNSFDQDIFNCDALEFTGYDQFDIIYFYCPFENNELQQQLEQVIYERSRADVVLIQALKQTHEDKKLKLVSGSVRYGVFVKNTVAGPVRSPTGTAKSPNKRKGG